MNPQEAGETRTISTRGEKRAQVGTIEGRADIETQVIHMRRGTWDKRRAQQDFKMKQEMPDMILSGQICSDGLRRRDHD